MAAPDIKLLHGSPRPDSLQLGESWSRQTVNSPEMSVCAFLHILPDDYYLLHYFSSGVEAHVFVCDGAYLELSHPISLSSYPPYPSCLSPGGGRPLRMRETACPRGRWRSIRPRDTRAHDAAAAI